MSDVRTTAGGDVGSGRGSGADWAEGVGQVVAESLTHYPDPTSIVIDTSVPHPARRYDYLLGGKTHYAVDRESAEAIAGAFPGIRTAALENRRFLRRAVTMLARDHGIDQFLDIGTGIPSPGNTHEVAQAIIPSARVLYVDNDPVVLAHSQALLDGTRQGRTAYIHADLRVPDGILDHPQLVATLDLSRPVGLMIVAVLHFLTDEDRPYDAVARLVAALAPGSFLVLSHGTWDFMPPEMIEQIRALSTPKTGVFATRTHAELAGFFAGLDLIPPGIFPLNRWRADDESQPRPTDAETAFYGAVGRLP
jgi:SAM-dependent methyltransferase